MLALSQALPTDIHIKIFPHLTSYGPASKDFHPDQVTLKSSGACKIYGGATASASSNGVLRSSVTSLNMTLSLKSLVAPLWFDCSQPITVVRLGAQKNYNYGGKIYAHPVSTGPELIEVKSINDYLKGVVPSEMYVSWPAEALKAQAVAARTYSTFHIVAAGSSSMYDFAKLYDVDDTVLYQAYTGESDRTAATDAAVDATGSIVMLYQGKVIQAYFSADAGGYTEDASHVWPVDAPYCVAKPEIYQNAPISPQTWGPWTVTATLDQLNNKLVAEGVISEANPVVDLRVDEANKYESGRVKLVTLELQDGTSKLVDSQQFHRALGLRSTLFTVGLNDNGDVQVIGRGFGHGVGMSQYGARVLAQLSSWDDEKILGFYYTGIQFCEPNQATGGMSCH